MPQKKTNTLQTIHRAFDIIDCLREMEGAGVTEVAEERGIPTSTAHSYLTTLEQSGYIVNRDGTYFVGLRFLELGENARAREKIYELGRAEVDKLANETGELASMMIEEHGKGVYLHRSRGDQAVLADTKAGHHVHLHCRAAGKAILAHLPRSRVNDVIGTHGLPKNTENTISTRSELFEKLENIRDRGYAIDDGEQLTGLRCIGAPITSNNDVVGALSVSGPQGRLRGERFEERIPDMIISAANVIEINLSYS